MTWKVATLVSLFVIATLATVTAQGPPDEPGPPDNAGPPECRPGTALENDEVRVWFQGLKGHVKVFDQGPPDDQPSNNTTGDNNTTGGQDENNTSADWHLVYQYKTAAIREVNNNTTLATLGLQRAFPQTSECTVEETDTHVNITFNVTEDVRAFGGGTIGQANVSLAYHFAKEGRGAKFDLIVENWPWVNNTTSLLAFDIDVTSGNNTVEEIDNGVGFRDPEGNQRGFINWDDEATARYDDGHEENATVTSEVDGNNTSHADITLTFENVTANYTELVYDPFVGVGAYTTDEPEKPSPLDPIRDQVDPIIDILPEPLRSVIRQILDDLPF